jgi:uncharacterized membrane protein YcfT
VFRPLCFCGRNSIVIYLAFLLPIAAMRALVLATGCIAGIGTMSVIATAACIFGSFGLLAARGTWAAFLFERPARFWLTAKPACLEPKMTLQPAE